MKLFKNYLALVLVLSMSMAGSGLSFAASAWSEITRGNALESAGSIAEAVPHWELAVEYSLEATDEGACTNAALMAKKLGKYYDELGNYPLAVKYYELENDFWVKVGNDWGTADLARANEIRSYIRYYAQNANRAAGYALEKFEPEKGVYLGIYAENDREIGQKIAKTKDVYGKEHAIYMYYQDFNQWMNDYSGYGQSAMDSINAKHVEEIGGALQVAMNAMSGLETVEKNDWLIKWAKEAARYDMPIFLRFCGEMNGDWVPWHGDPALYIEKFRLVHDVMQEYAPNVAMVWCPNDVPVELNGQTIGDYYPGDAYVDWVGINFYVDYYDSGLTDGPSNYLQNPMTHLEYIYDNYADKKPIMICETGVAHHSIPNDESVTQWGAANLEKLYAMLPVLYPRVKAITYLSLNQANENYMVGNRWSNYALSENDVMQETYKRLIQSDNYLSEVVDNARVSLAPFSRVDSDSLFSQDKLVLDVKVPDFKVSRVSVFSDNGYSKSMTEMPYEIEGEALDGNLLSIQVFDSAGKLVINELIKK